MKKNTLFLTTIGLVSSVLTGCATQQAPQVPQVDNKLIVSQPFEYKVAQSADNIERHLFLLYKLETNAKVEATPVIEHNQNLHADKKTITSLDEVAHKYESKPEVKAEVKPEVKAEVKPEVKAEVKPEVKATAWEGDFLQKVEVIDWNDKVEPLVKNIAKTVKYDFVVVGSSSKNVEFVAKNQTLGEVLDSLGKKLGKEGTILVSHKSKKITLVFPEAVSSKK